MLFRSEHSFFDKARRRIRQSRKDAAGVKPANSLFAEDLVPIKIAGLELRCGCETTVGDANSAADTKSALREVKAVADSTTNTIVRTPFDVRSIHAALQNEIFDQVAHLVVCESGRDRGAHA